MKKILVVLLLISITFATTACSGLFGGSEPIADDDTIQYDQYEDVTLSSEGISITLPGDFEAGVLDSSENPDITTTFSNSSETIIILAIQEFKSELDVSSIYEYMQLQCNNLPEGATKDNLILDEDGNYPLSEDDGVVYFEYTYLNPGGEPLKYLNTAYETDDAIWFVQFCCTEDDYDLNKADFIKWAKTVSFY